MTLNVNIKKKLENFELNIDFKSNSNRIGLFGPSGAGKTQLLKGIAGITELDSAYIEHDGKVFYSSDKTINIPTQERKIGYLFQNYALFPHMTVRKQIEFVSKVENLEELYKKFKIEHLLESKPKSISGGEAQRVAMVRMLASKTNLILLDEPFSAMDVNLKIQLRCELREILKEFNGIVIMVSHDIEDITELSDEVIFIEEGKIIAREKVNSLNEKLNKDMARLIGYEKVNLNGEILYYNPKKFKDEYFDGATEFKGKIESIINSINYKILNLNVSGQIIRVEIADDRENLKVDNELIIYQKAVN